MSDRDRCGWVSGTNPQDARIHRFVELLSEELPAYLPVLEGIGPPLDKHGVQFLCAAIWRRIEEDGTGDG